MKNKKILKRGIALLCAAAILIGGVAILATNSKAETVAEQLKADGYTRVTPKDFGITEEKVFSKSGTLSDSYRAQDVKTFDGTYFDADISITEVSTWSANNRMEYLGQFFWIFIQKGYLRIYKDPTTNIYYQQLTNKTLTEAGIRAGEYFNIKIATDIETNATETTNTDITFNIWVNDTKIVTDKKITVATDTIKNTLKLQATDDNQTVKIKPPVNEVEQPESPEITDDLEGYTKMTPATFNIQGEAIHTYETENIWKTYTAQDVTSFDKKYFDADISLTNCNSINNAIRYMGSEMFFIYIGWNQLRVYDYQNNTLLYCINITTNDSSVSAGEYFHLKLATCVTANTDSTKSDITLKLWINDDVIEPESGVSSINNSVTVTVSTTKLAQSMYVAMQSAGTTKIREHVEEEEPVEGVDPNLPDALKDYDRITLPEHFGIEAAEDEAGTPYKGSTSKAYSGETLHKTYLEVDVHFNNKSDTAYLQYMHENDWDKYARLIHYGSGLSVFEGNNSSNSIWITSAPKDEFFNLKLAVDMVTNATDSLKSDISLQVWINNVLQGTLKFTATTAEANRFYIYATSDNPITLKTPVYTTTTPDEPDEPTDDSVTNLSDVTYELSSGAGYLLTGTGEVYVNDVKTDVGTALRAPGDYVIKRVEKTGATYIQNVSLYKIGDVNLGGGEEWTVDDRADIERIIAGTLTSAAAMKAADINNDGKVAKSDLELMKKVLKGELKKADVIEKYHAPSVTYDYLGGDSVMPIGGYFGPYSEATVTDAIYKAIAQSGVNLIVKSEMDYSSTDKQELIKQGLTYAEKYGIGVFLSDARLNSITKDSNKLVTEYSYVSEPTDLAALLADYSKYEAFLGNMIVDEPISDSGFGSIGATDYRRFKYYKNIATALNAYANQTGYVNLLSNFHMTGDITYEAYLREVGKSMKLLSFDSYPFYTKEGISGGLANYLQSLGTVSKVAREDGYPFWSYVQAGTDYRDDGAAGTSDTALTQAQTLWNVNTSLAFGAKGIVYFPLVQPSNYANVDGSTFDYNRNGLIGADNKINNQYTDDQGNKYGYYTWVQTANKQVAAVDEVLMRALNQGVVVNGMAAAAVNEAGNVESIITSTNRLTGVSGDTMVGCFTYGDTEAFYVVNYNYNATEKQTITLTLDDDHQYRLIQAGATTYGKSVDNQITVTLSAGEGVLIVLEDHVVYYEDISEYRAESGYTAPEAPAGYLFAGWYKDEACTKGNAVGQKVTDGGAYAKFVDANLLTVKAQITANTTAESEQTSIRFVTAVNDLNYQKVAFLIRIHKDSGIEERDRGDNVVYKELTAMVGDTVWKYKPQNLFCSTATYFKAWIINKIPKANFDTKFEVSPYWMTLDGTTVYGTTAIKTVRQGIK